jgi:membrane-associated protease RseP (regulator of RpoE activity)
MSESLSSSSPTYAAPVPVDVFVVRPPRRRYWLHALLFLATVFTTLVVGARMEYNFLNNRRAFSLEEGTLPLFPVEWTLERPSRLLLGVPFAAILMLILLAHEMGHYVYCVKYGVYATLPFFIPAPTLIGTLGAFIRIRSPIRSRSALFDIGIAGPIAGFVVALITLAFAISLSKPQPLGVPISDIQFGYPLIFYLAHGVIAGSASANIPMDHLYLHPIGIAAWVGMFATALNLLPGGQLDGGHILYALWPHAHRQITRLTIAALVGLGTIAVLHTLDVVRGGWWGWEGWLVWGILITFTGTRHPQVISWPGLNGTRKALAVVALLMLVLTFVPTPFYRPLQ